MRRAFSTPTRKSVMLRHYSGVFFSAPEPAGHRQLLLTRVSPAAFVECTSREEERSMAQFCTTCGTLIPEGMKFCTGCGATVGAAPAPAVASQAAAVPAAVPMPGAVPGMRVAPAPAAKSGSPVVKIVLIVLAVFIFLGLLMAGSCVYLVYRAKQRVTQFEKQARASFPVQTATPQATTPPPAAGQAASPEAAPAIDLATLVYPGSTPKAGASVAVGGFQVQQYETDDPADKVLAYYKDKLGQKALVQETGNQAVLQMGEPNGLLTITIAHGDAGKTNISVTRIGK